MMFQARGQLPFPMHERFSNFFDMSYNSFVTNTIVVDKTCYIRDLEGSTGSFFYMFFRPRRWGKSTFLNMLAAYYDIETQNLFERVFRKLDIGKSPTRSHNSHLVLLFDLSGIKPSGSREDIEKSVTQTIIETLSRFLFKYRNVLYYSEEGGIISSCIVPGCAGASLDKVLVSKIWSWRLRRH
jgi:hypothetical protein